MFDLPAEPAGLAVAPAARLRAVAPVAAGLVAARGFVAVAPAAEGCRYLGQPSRGWKHRGSTPESVRAPLQDERFSFSYLGPLFFFGFICDFDATIAGSAKVKVLEHASPLRKHSHLRSTDSET